MDPNAIDRLARLVGSGQSRRRVVKTLAGGALGAVAAALGLGETNAARLRSVGNSCNLNSDCASGLCVQEGRTRKICHCTGPSDCPAATDQCRTAACLLNGYCGTAVTTGAPCNDGNLCTTGDVCQANGTCAGTPKVCVASDQCHLPGTCDPQSGVCSNPSKPNGSACDDGDGCTQTDACQTGVCVGSNPVVCVASDQCHTAGTCDPSTGLCSNPSQPDGTACDDGDPSTCGDVCMGGTCAGTPADFSSDDHNCGACDNVCTGVGVVCNSSRCCQGDDGLDAACSAATPCCFSSDICNENGYCCLVGGTGTCYTDDPSGACCGLCQPDDSSCAGHCPGVCCDPDDQATTCAGKCGTQTNNCGQSVECACTASQLCTGGACVAGQGTCAVGQNFCADLNPGCNGRGDCFCRISTEGDTRCGGNGLGGDCGECGSSADCATLYPGVPGAFCLAGGTGCCDNSAPRGLCTAPCPTA